MTSGCVPLVHRAEALTPLPLQFTESVFYLVAAVLAPLQELSEVVINLLAGTVSLSFDTPIFEVGASSECRALPVTHEHYRVSYMHFLKLRGVRWRRPNLSQYAIEGLDIVLGLRILARLQIFPLVNR